MGTRYYQNQKVCYVTPTGVYAPALGQLSAEDEKKMKQFQAVKCGSLREGRRLFELLQLQKVGEIEHLRHQMPMPIYVNEEPVWTYIADFAYYLPRTRERVIEDTKGTWLSPTFRMKWKAIQAQHPELTFFLNAENKRPNTRKAKKSKKKARSEWEKIAARKALKVH